ncbi:hypothetical protein E3T55_00075 [Cryobacterium frigoriphilum]|uniref:Uncharacterized protein n=1 Tax=Cryobacterium frigoriphilum TaxID=1259150 RepID=A0A4R9AB82_9MICO|nr:hypothetical protein [Cryobacterium frigoriphilum]TFD56080.1 hypothetical protein E3T55_00075 [Cryobacterium frigoriphilum]
MYDREFEPLQGDSGLLATKSADYLRMADAISRATASLRVVADTSEMQSSAVAAVRENATKVADSIAQAESRYRDTAEALSTYSGALNDAQVDAQTAIASIGSAESEYRTAQSRADTAEETATEATPEQAANQQTARGLVTDAAEKLEGIVAAQTAWRTASAAKETAASTAAAAIHTVVKDSDLNDSWWDNWGADLVAFVWEKFRQLCDIAGILAIFLSWVPGLGQVLLALAAVGALINIIEAAVKVATGEGSWTDLIVAVALGVVSCFGGKILGQFSKMARAKGVVKANGLAFSTGMSRTALQGRPPAGQFMNQSAARAVTNNPPPFRSNFSDPFGIRAAGEGWPGSIREVLREGIGITDDLAPISRMGANGVQPISTGTKAVVGAGQLIVTGEVLYSNGVVHTVRAVTGK